MAEDLCPLARCVVGASELRGSGCRALHPLSLGFGVEDGSGLRVVGFGGRESRRERQECPDRMEVLRPFV